MNSGRIVASAWINSQQAKEVAAYYLSGHSVKETASYFGVSKCQVNNLAKKRGLTNGKKFREARIEYAKHEAEKRLVDDLAGKGFDYVGGYSDRNSRIRIRCLTCGEEFERTYNHLKNGNVICRVCKLAETEAENKQRADEQKLKSELSKLQRELEKRFKPPKNHYEDMHNAFLNRTGICEICGNSYLVRDYVESCGLRMARDNGVCSAECRAEKKKRVLRAAHKGRQDSHRQRAKKNGCEYDSSVTLKKLIKRDGLQCALCGGMCDVSDHRWSEHSGPLYPSIDHIIPMSKGGGHVWGNVQIAHMICNSLKGDMQKGGVKNE